jgi:hypothetical protein
MSTLLRICLAGGIARPLGAVVGAAVGDGVPHQLHGQGTGILPHISDMSSSPSMLTRLCNSLSFNF